MTAKLLIADDYHSLRRNICKFLADKGYDVAGASDGAEAAVLVKSEHFDLVIADVFMPRMNGFELAELVKSLSPPTPVLLMTSYPCTPSEEAAYEILHKPFELEPLSNRIEDLLRRGPQSRREG
jgi:DNA-binding response OmpR family regulator